MQLEPGLTGESTTTVVHENTAAYVGAGGVEVFATPMMIALMEQAAWQSVANNLDPGYVTVGTSVNVRHLAATPIGQRVLPIAELMQINARRLVFNVQPYDENQKIATTSHNRYLQLWTDMCVKSEGVHSVNCLITDI